VTTPARRRFQSPPPLETPPTRRRRGWFVVVFGLLLGLAAVCHGCHAGDHDGELSVHGSVRSSGERGASLP
jgi:hypothetical protein